MEICHLHCVVSMKKLDHPLKLLPAFFRRRIPRQGDAQSICLVCIGSWDRKKLQNPARCAKSACQLTPITHRSLGVS